MQPNKYVAFRTELELLINKCSMENGSDTPDFILAEYLTKQLELWDVWVKRRDAWYGTNRSQRANFEAPPLEK